MAENDYAIVVGVKDYSVIQPSLPGAVSDAIKMAKWLVDKGGVPYDNLSLLLSPAQPEILPKGWHAGKAGHEEIDNTIRRVVKESSDTAPGRFFFYFAGHGGSIVTNTLKDVIFPDDFPDKKAFDLDSLVRSFMATKFREQYFIFDCCRNLWRRRHNPDEFEFEVPENWEFSGEQFVFSATKPGSKAADTNGTLTDALLKGLTGGAMRWEQFQKVYQIGLRELIHYVAREFDRLKRDNKKLQEPVLPSEPGSAAYNPILATLLQNVDVKPVSLTIKIEPAEIAPRTEVLLGSATMCEPLDHIDKMPSRMLYPNMWYVICAKADGFARKMKPLFLETDESVTVTLTPSPGDLKSLREQQDSICSTLQLRLPSAQAPQVAAFAFPAGHTPGIRSIPLLPPVPSKVLPSAQGVAANYSVPPILTNAIPQAFPNLSGRLTVQSDDDLVLVRVSTGSSPEVTIPSSTPLAQPQYEPGRRLLFEPPPGFSQVRLLMPSRFTEPTLVFLSPGEAKQVSLKTPTPPDTRLFRELVRLIGNDFEEVTGLRQPTGTFRAALLVALAAHMPGRTRHLDGRDGGAAYLGFKNLRETVPVQAVGAVRILVAVDLDDGEQARRFTERMTIRLWPIDAGASPPERPERSTRLAGVAALTRPADPGTYWIAVKLPDKDELLLPLTVLKGHLAELVLAVDPQGRAEILQFMEGLVPNSKYDPIVLRRAELAQRHLQAGHLGAVHEITESIRRPTDRDSDAVLADLDSYATWNESSFVLSSERVRALVDAYPGWSDFSVLEAKVNDSPWSRNAEQSAKACRRALDAGLPALGAWLDELCRDVARYRVDHPRAALLRRVCRGRIGSFPWTAWVPGAITTGKPIVAD